MYLCLKKYVTLQNKTQLMIMKEKLLVAGVLLMMLTPGSAQTETRQLSIDTKTLGI